MLEYNGIDISEGIDIEKCKGTSRECRFPPNPYLGKRRISLGVTSILSTCLPPHT